MNFLVTIMIVFGGNVFNSLLYDCSIANTSQYIYEKLTEEEPIDLASLKINQTTIGDNYIVNYLVHSLDDVYVGSFLFDKKFGDRLEFIQYGKSNGKINIQKFQVDKNNVIVSLSWMDEISDTRLIVYINDEKYEIDSNALHYNKEIKSVKIENVRVSVYTVDDHGKEIFQTSS